jgi:hypothetical protein
MAQSVGVDISKDTLDIHMFTGRLGATPRERCERDQIPAGVASQIPRARIVFEPIGLPPSRGPASAGRGRAPAGQDQPATPRPTSSTLRRLGAALEPASWLMISKTLDELREPHVARTALVKDRVAAQNCGRCLRLTRAPRRDARISARRALHPAVVAALQSSPQGKKIRRLRPGRKTTQAHHYGDHAKADHPRKRLLRNGRTWAHNLA